MGNLKELRKTLLARWKLIAVVATVVACPTMAITGYITRGAAITVGSLILIYIYLLSRLHEAISTNRKKPWEKFAENFIHIVKTGKLEDLIIESGMSIDHTILQDTTEDTPKKRFTMFFQEILLPRICSYNQLITPLRKKSDRLLISAGIFTCISGTLLILITYFFNYIYSYLHSPFIVLAIFFLLISDIISLRYIKAFYETLDNARYYQDKMIRAESQYLELERSLKNNNTAEANRSLKSLISDNTQYTGTIKLKNILN